MSAAGAAMFRRYAEDPVARAMLTQHAESCRVDKEDLKRELREQRADIGEKHGENQKELGSIKRLIYIAVGAVVVLSWLFEHGHRVLEVLQH
jgi:hypothetical protein